MEVNPVPGSYRSMFACDREYNENVRVVSLRAKSFAAEQERLRSADSATYVRPIISIFFATNLFNEVLVSKLALSGPVDLIETGNPKFCPLDRALVLY